MKSYISRLLIVIALFVLLLAVMNYLGQKITDKGRSERNVVTDRINAEFEARLENTALSPEELREEVFSARRAEWEELYGKEACPDDIRVVLIEASGNEQKGNAGGSLLEYGEEGTKLRGICLKDGTLVGIAEYRFDDPAYDRIRLLMNIGIIAAAILTTAYGLWIYGKVILPFNRLSDYPERLSKGEMTEKLPEKKDHFFGRYIWGMNMLSDKLENDRKTLRKLNVDHQKFVTTLVHGIKTPAVNIKLMAEAIATGLYDPEGKINEKDAELAVKIEGKADEIERLVAAAVDETNTAIFEYDPEAKAFYRDEILKFIEEEYTNTFKVARISFNTVSEGNPMIASDLSGVRRILRQILDNAIKYGDGKKVTLKMEKREEGHFISVSNSGETLPDTELPFVFNSLWRGSNSGKVNGSGVGLYEARLIARKLGGDLRMRTGDHETELILFLPL
ncbi:MAG: HAMP domain-containing histidine kinase [Lachnospiraceae bacterium]|nr:HAMP domain-containing histidine kinase [Lachnospiraceae bacterium]